MRVEELDFGHQSVNVLLDVLKPLEGEEGGLHALELDHDWRQRVVEAVGGLRQVFDARRARKAALERLRIRVRAKVIIQILEYFFVLKFQVQNKAVIEIIAKHLT